MKVKAFSSPGRMESFRFAINGLLRVFKEEPNARIHLCSSLLVTALGFWLQLSMFEWILLVIVAGLVWVAEIINTAIERVMDFIQPGYDEKAGQIKDMAAAAVLISAIVAAVTGLFIFIPKIF